MSSQQGRRAEEDGPCERGTQLPLLQFVSWLILRTALALCLLVGREVSLNQVLNRGGCFLVYVRLLGKLERQFKSSIPRP